MPEAEFPDWHDPLWSRVPLPLEHKADALGLEIHMRTNAPEIAALFHAAFGAWIDGGDGSVGAEGDRRPPGAAERATDLVIEAAAELDGRGLWAAGDATAPLGGSSAGVRAGRAARDGARHDGAHREGDAPAATADGPRARHHAPGRSFHRERGPLYTAGDDRGSVVCADLAVGRAAAFIAHGCRADIARLVLIESPVWRLATWRGMVALHAAALHIDGAGVVLRGAPGAGKSTLSAAALAAGHGVLADEVTWWDPAPASNGGARAPGPGPGLESGSRPRPESGSPAAPNEASLLRGLGRWIHVEPELAARFPELVRTREDAAGEPRGKIALAVPASQSVTRVSPGPLVLLELDDIRPKRSSWQSLAPEAASRRFEAMRIRGEGSQPPSSFAAARAALAAGGAYALRAGPPSAAIKALEEIVVDWRQRFRAMGADRA